MVDRGYSDYALFHTWTKQGVFFVTRRKDNAKYTVAHPLIRPDRQEIASDECMHFSSDYAQARCPDLLRRVVVRDTTGGEIVLLVAIYRFRSTFGWHLSRLVALRRVNLVTYRALWD